MYHWILVKEFQHNRRWRFQCRLSVTKKSDLTDNYGLVPGGAKACLSHSRTNGVPAKWYSDIKIRFEAKSFAPTVHIPGLVDVASKLVCMNLCNCKMISSLKTKLNVQRLWYYDNTSTVTWNSIEYTRLRFYWIIIYYTKLLTQVHKYILHIHKWLPA